MPQTVDVLLDQRGVTISWLADSTAIPIDKIDAIVNGRWLPSPEHRIRIAEAFGVAVDAISWGHTMNPRNVRYHRYGIPKDFSDRGD